MFCPCNSVEDEIICEKEVCPHISPRRGWVSGDQIDLWKELPKFGICDSKNKAKILVKDGAVKVWNGKSWNKTKDRFIPFMWLSSETFVIVGKKKIMCHFLKAVE